MVVIVSNLFKNMAKVCLAFLIVVSITLISGFPYLIYLVNVSK